MLFVLTHFRGAKPFHTFAGNALCLAAFPGRKTVSHFCWKCSLSCRISRAQNRFTLLLEMLFVLPHFPGAKPFHTFAGNALCLDAFPGRKTVPHFCWKCSLSCRISRAQNRFTLLLEMLFVLPHFPGAKP